MILLKARLSSQDVKIETRRGRESYASSVPRRGHLLKDCRDSRFQPEIAQGDSLAVDGLVG